MRSSFAVVAIALGCLGPRSTPAPRVAIEAPPPAPTVAGAEPKPRPAMRIVPKPESLSTAESLLAVKTTTATHRTIYMNLGGGTYTHASDNSAENRASVTPKNRPSVTIPAYEKNDKSRLELVACTKAAFARWNVTVTTEDPGAAPHVEVVVGGVPALLDLEKNVGGIAPMYGDCDMVERAVVFVFSKIYKDARDECETVAHEAGHAMGLDHELLCEDPMTYLEGCGQKVFQDKQAPCGEGKPRSCMCGATQNSVSFLDARLGKAEGAPPIALPPITLPPTPTTPPPPPPPPPASGDGEPPRIAPLAPADGTKLPENASVTLAAHVTDDVKVAKVSLLWTIAGKTTEIDCAAPPSGITCTNFFGAYSFQLPGGKGPRSWAIKAIDGAGNVRVSEPRALMLGEGGAAPEAPTKPTAAAPTLTFVGPDNGAIFHFGSTIPVRVSVSGVVAAVQVVWRTHSGDEIVGLEKVNATTWGADLAVPKLTLPGPRTIRVRVPGGNATLPADRVITILP